MFLGHDESGSLELDPIGALCEYLTEQKLPFEREEHNLDSADRGPRTCHYFRFTWLWESGVVLYTHSFDLDIPDERCAEVERLVIRVTQNLYLGHFEYRDELKRVVYRYGLYIDKDEDAGERLYGVAQCGVTTCEEYYPWFKAVVDGRSALEVVDIFERMAAPMGEA